MDTLNTYGQSILKRPEKDSFFTKFWGPTESSILESIKLAKEITTWHKAARFGTVKDGKEAEALWADRKNTHYAGLALMLGCKCWLTDVWLVFFSNQLASIPEVGFSVPVSKLPELVYETKREIKEASLLGVICGHVGDGEFHAGRRSSSKPY